ncbi:hypothetical protein NB689_002033 [Xanthomonas sacchari]|nr:hypothetical protein [Xanthomonas sacchari]
MRGVDQPGRHRRGEAAHRRSGQAIGQREAGGAHLGRHHLGQRHHHRTVVGTVQQRQPLADQQQPHERRRVDQPLQRRPHRQQHGHAGEHQQRLAADAVAQRAHHRQPHEIGQADAAGHQQAVELAQVQLGAAVGRHVGGNQVERHGGHHHHAHAAQDQPDIGAQRARDAGQVRRLARGEFRGFLQRAADQEDQRHDQAADGERHTPAPAVHRAVGEQRVQGHAERSGEHHRHLLAGRLPGHIEAAPARRGDLGQIHRHAAQLGAGGEALQQAAEQHQQRRQHADGAVAGDEGDQQHAGRHQPQGQDQALATPVPVDVTAEHQRADRPHQEAGAERGQRQHQRGERAMRREERMADGRGIEAIDHEVVHLEEVAGDHAEHGGGAVRRGLGGGGRSGRSHRSESAGEETAPPCDVVRRHGRRAQQRYNTSRAHAAMTLHAATCGLMHSGTTPRPELPLMQHRVHPDTRR